MLLTGAGEKTRGDSTRQIANLLGVVVTIGVNALANILPINGRNTGQIADTFPVYVIPAGYAFSIWSLIYIGLIAFAIYGMVPAQATNPAFRKIGWWFVASCAANSAWIVLWHYGQYALTLGAMLVLLLSLAVIYARLREVHKDASPITRWLVHVPFSIYLGWITVATILNATVVLYDAGWSGWGLSAEAWGAVMVVAGLVIALAVGVINRDVPYLLVIVWAFAGIIVKHGGVPLVAPAAIVSTIVAGIAALGIVAWTLTTRLRGPSFPSA